MRYIKEILFKNKGLVFVYIAIGIFNAFLTNFKVDYFQQVVDGLAEESIVLSGIITYGIILVINYLMNYLDEYPSKKLAEGIYLDFKLLALKKISKINYLAYQKEGIGKLTQRIESGARAGKNLLYDFWFCVIRNLLPTIAFSMYFIWKMSKPITFAILGGYIIIFIITNVLLKVLYQIKERILTNEEQMNHYLVRGFMEMIVFRMEKQFPNEIRKASLAKKEIVRSKVKMNMIHEAFFTVFALLVALLNIGILLYAWYTKSLSIGAIVALLSLIDNAYTPIAIFNVLYVQYKLDKASFHRFENFLELEDDVQLNQGKELTTLGGNIEINHLSFQYEDQWLFKDLNLSIKQGEKVAFVGESGSGKSTLVKLIAGLIKYDTGSIQIDGQELKEICLNSLYDHLSYISQDSPIFDGTLRENLVFDRDISDDVQVKALEKMCLLTLYQNMKKGLETEIGERGMILSGGERQRLAIARLCFERKAITILDEATSAMDNLTEESTMNELTKMLKDQTVIAIAHRLSSIRNFDHIIVFKQGKVVGQGTFDELLKDNEYFIELYNASVS
ncbi:MAG: ABC transporter ATP-binding protein [Cellulosilyticum sp.]|nr:ABC transporter ATP-binding protein [Cellulosilyticum sp.]